MMALILEGDVIDQAAVEVLAAGQQNLTLFFRMQENSKAFTKVRLIVRFRVKI
jgi:hypothetical protein